MLRVLRVKLQIQFSLIDVMLMGLKLSPSSTNKYITGTLNKGKGKGKGREGKEKKGKERKGKEGKGKGKRRERMGRERKGEGKGKVGKGLKRGWIKGVNGVKGGVKVEKGEELKVEKGEG